MPIAIACQHCDWKGKVKDELAGKKGKCPTCGELVPIPNKSGPPPVRGARRSVDDEPDVVDDADVVEESPRPRGKPKSKSLDEALGAVGRGRRDDDRPRTRRRDEDDDDRPRRRRPADEEEDSDRPRRRRLASDDDDDRPTKARRRPADDDDDDRPSKVRRRPVDDDDDGDRPSKARRRPVDDDDDAQPRRKKRPGKRRRPKKSGISGKRIGAILGGVLAVLVGGGLLAWFLLGDGRRIVYPILLLICGVIGIFQGATGMGLSEDDDSSDDDD